MSSQSPNNQNNFTRITQHIIEPMRSHWSIEFKADKINDFVIDLSKFDTPTLQRAMQFLRTECEMPPRLASVVKACREHKTVKHASGEDPADWLRKTQEENELRMTRARTKAREYTEQKISEIRDKIGEWDASKQRDMLDYIAKSADLQGQFIEKIRNCGYSSPMIFGIDHAEERRLWWLAMCREQKEFINVVIPWKWFGVHEPMLSIGQRADL
jgi:hypothetical protein